MAYCNGSNERKAKVCKSLALKKLFFAFALHMKWVVSLCSAGEKASFNFTHDAIPHYLSCLLMSKNMINALVHSKFGSMVNIFLIFTFSSTFVFSQIDSIFVN